MAITLRPRKRQIRERLAVLGIETRKSTRCICGAQLSMYLDLKTDKVRNEIKIATCPKCGFKWSLTGGD